MTKEQLLEKLATIIVEYLKDEDEDAYQFFIDACDLLEEVDPDRYNQIFNEND